MKRFFGLIFTFVISQSAFAGSAFINNFQADGSGQSCFRFTNISGEVGELQVTLFDQNGNAFTGGTFDHVFFTGLGNTFNVPARSTARFCTLLYPPGAVGYGVVESSSTSNGRKQFIGLGLYNSNNGTVSYAIPVNDNRPF